MTVPHYGADDPLREGALLLATIDSRLAIQRANRIGDPLVTGQEY